jgi:hypothetical protein
MLRFFLKMLMLILLPTSVNIKIPQSACAYCLNFYIHSYVDVHAHCVCILVSPI